MENKTITTKILLSGLIAIVIFFSDMGWNDATVQKDIGKMSLFLLLLFASFLTMAFIHGFRPAYLRQGIRKERINFAAVIGYFFLLFIILGQNDIKKVCYISLVLGVLFTIFIVTIAITPFFMVNASKAKPNS